MKRKFKKHPVLSSCAVIASSISLADIEQLIEEGDWISRRHIAEDKSTPTEILAKLAEDEVENVRSGVSANPNTPPQILAKLADDLHWDVVKYVALNPNTPPKTLAKLADDEDDSIRMFVAYNKSTPPQVLLKLADDEHYSVRKEVAENPNTPPEALVISRSNEDTYNEELDDMESDAVVRLHQLNESDEDFDMFEAEDSYLGDLENECLDELGLWLEPSIQGNQGGIWIYTQGGNETVLENYDYESYVERCIDIALDSDNEEEFKSRYTQFINSIID